MDRDQKTNPSLPITLRFAFLIEKNIEGNV